MAQQIQSQKDLDKKIKLTPIIASIYGLSQDWFNYYLNKAEINNYVTLCRPLMAVKMAYWTHVISASNNHYFKNDLKEEIMDYVISKIFNIQMPDESTRKNVINSNPKKFVQIFRMFVSILKHSTNTSGIAGNADSLYNKRVSLFDFVNDVVIIEKDKKVIDQIKAGDRNPATLYTNLDHSEYEIIFVALFSLIVMTKTIKIGDKYYFCGINQRLEIAQKDINENVKSTNSSLLSIFNELSVQYWGKLNNEGAVSVLMMMGGTQRMKNVNLIFILPNLELVYYDSSRDKPYKLVSIKTLSEFCVVGDKQLILYSDPSTPLKSVSHHKVLGINNDSHKLQNYYRTDTVELFIHFNTKIPQKLIEAMTLFAKRTNYKQF